MAENKQNKTEESKEEDHNKKYISTKRKWKNIKDLKEELIKKLSQIFDYPSVIQADSLKYTLNSQIETRGFFIKAPNGSGKTACITIPALNMIDPSKQAFEVQEKEFTDRSGKKELKKFFNYKPQVILVSTNAVLVRDLAQFCRKITPDSWQKQLEVTELYQGLMLDESKHGQILCSTPDLLHALLFKYKKIKLDELRYIALDEADYLWENQDHRSDFIDLFKNGIKNLTKVKFVCTSATMSPSFKKQFQQAIKEDVVQIALDLNLEGVTQYYHQIQGKDAKDEESLLNYKSQKLVQILNTTLVQKKIETRIIVFVNKKKDAETFQKQIEADQNLKGKVRTSYLTADVKTEDKFKIIDEFRRENGGIDVLFCTDILARGIDFRNVQLVVNLSVPRQQFKKDAKINVTTYLHRVARTGRFLDTGVALTFYDPKDKERNNDEFLTQLVKKIFNQDVDELKSFNEQEKFYEDIKQAVDWSSKVQYRQGKTIEQVLKQQDAEKELTEKEQEEQDHFVKTAKND